MDEQDEQDFVLVEEHDYDENGFPQPQETINAIQKWLQPTDYLADSSEYKKHLHSHVSGTGHWIRETEIYQKWLDSPSYGSMWIKATAGAGKSVLAATIASKLADTAPVLFFFFRQIVTTNHDPHALTRDLISQALQYSPLLQSKMKNYVDEGRSLDSISVNELWGHLVNALDLLPRAYRIIDALDEMDTDEEKFLASLVALGRRKAASIKVMMTSRPLPRIETYLKDPSILQLRLERRLVDEDISTYVDHRLDQRTDLKDEVRLAIKQSMQDKAQGSFLYARLMMDELLDHRKQMTPDIVFLERSLNSLPHSLEDMYDGMLSDHSRRSSIPQDLQLAILRCVTHSTRPLRLLELAAMLDYIQSPTLAKFKDQETPRSHSMTSLRDTKAVVRKACGPLLEIVEDETISVIHHTFTEFLIDPEREGRLDDVHSQFPVISPANTHHNLAVTCLRYLECLSEWEVKTRVAWMEQEFHDATRLRNLKLQYPFVDYAMTNWRVHVRKLEVLGHKSFIETQSGTQDMSLYNILDNFIGAGQHQLFASWLDLVWPSCRDSKKLGSTGNISPLHVAAWSGMTGYARHLIKGGAEACCLDDQKMTPLSWAALKGHSEMVALLLEHDNPQLNSCYEYTVKPLRFAAQGNHYRIVKQLLAAGSSPLAGTRMPEMGPKGLNARDRRKTCLYYACSAGSAESVREMMPYLQTEYLNSALCYAIENGKTEVVETILTSPTVSVDGDSFTWDRALYLAAKGRHSAIMEALLAKRADPNKAADPSKAGRSPPFHALVEGDNFRTRQGDGWRTCFHMLLNAGADVNAVDGDGKTPLHLSVAGKTSKSHELTVLLLKNGANAVARDKNGNTPLHEIHVRSDSSHIIELLMSHGADMTSMRPSDGKTPLHVAVEKYDARDLQPMLKHTADCNIADFEGNTPLHSALAALINEPAAGRISDKAKMIGELIKAGADPNLRNKEGLTPLHFLDRDPSFRYSMHDSLRYSQVLNESVFPELSAVGADLEATDYDGRTILLRILGRFRGYKIAALVPVLLNCGSSTKARDHQGDSALHLLCRNGPDAKLLAMLIAKGADPFSVNLSGNTLLHEIGRAGNPSAFTELLLKQGLSPSARNNLGQTPLHLLCGTLPPAHTSWRSRMQFTLKSELASGLNMEDNNGIRPIHLAAAISGQFVAQLIAAGADPTASTKEGRTVLHVSSRARQSNIVGFVLDYYDRIGRLDLVDAPDMYGRTALHEACRSGRPESVKLLLNAGASVSLKAMSSMHHQICGNTNGDTALHFCAEFEEEKMFWSPIGRQMASKRAIDAAGILIADTNRPPLREKEWLLSRAGFRMFDPISEGNQDTYTARVRDIVEMLIEHGADVAAMNCSGLYAIDVATDTGCEDVIEVLLPYMKDVYAKEVEGSQIYKDRLFHGRTGHRFAEEYLSLRGRHVSSILTKEIIKGEGNTHLCAKLLALGKVETLKKLAKMGVDFTPRAGQTGFLEILSSCGYPSLLRALGKTVKKPWADGQESVDETKCILPFLLIACQRSLPNLDVIKVLVEDFGANVNYQFQSKAKGRLIGVYSYLECPTALHKLANEGHWWQIRAMDYLLDHGAIPELRNHYGETVLQIAVNKDFSSCSAFGSGGSDTLTGLEAPELLLKRGANPNAIDNSGLTCLNKAMRSIELVRMLTEYGADVTPGSKPVLFSAIELQDTSVVALLLELGADCNARQIGNGKESIRRIVDHEFYPLHYAAFESFNMRKHREQAIAIIHMLLSKGASPYLTFNNGKGQATILHDLLEHGGILQPFLEIPDLDLECRDPQGRTLLLAVCRSRFGTNNPGSLTSRERDLCIERDNFAERQNEEKITFANELISSMSWALIFS